MDFENGGSLKLNGDQTRLLAELIEREEAKLLVEIRHTANRAFREELKRRLGVIQTIEETIHQPA